MIIPFRTANIQFDVATEIRSCTVLNWLHFLENDAVSTMSPLEIHSHYIGLHVSPVFTDAPGPFFINRDFYDLFIDLFFFYKNVKKNFAGNIYEFLDLATHEVEDPVFKNCFTPLDASVYPPENIFGYDDMESVATMLETTYGKTIHPDIRNMYQSPKGYVEPVIVDAALKSKVDAFYAKNFPS